MLKFRGMKSADAHQLWQGGKDDHGNDPEVTISDGAGNPCRHCLSMIEKGDEFLILSYRPFDGLQPYAEQGPIFLHAKPCKAYQADSESKEHGGLPPVLHDSPHYLLRGYDAQQRIVYGSGAITEQDQITAAAEALLNNDQIEFVDIRSATNNCWQARVDMD